MNKREMIEKIIDIVKDFNEKNEWSDEHDFLSTLKSDCEKFKIKYEYLDKYDVELKLNNIHHDKNIQIDDRYADIHIYLVGNVLNSDKQPNDELLMDYSHSTGSYMFGGGWGDDYYDPELFQMYFEELKKYKYSYIDELNHHIYFTVDEGMKLYKNYKDICKKYQNLFDERRKKAKADELREQLKKLEQGE